MNMPLKFKLVLTLTLLIFLMFSFNSHAAITEPNVFIIQDDGTMVSYGGAGDRPVSGSTAIVNAPAVLKKFYESHPDIYDFAIIYSTIPTDVQTGNGLTVKNGVRGNGSFFPDLDETAKYGSKGKLRLQVFMPPKLGIDNLYDEDQWHMLLHEFSHLWLMFIGDIADCATRPDFNVKCKNQPTEFRVNSNGAHWSDNVDTAIRENGIVYEDPNGGGAYNYSNGYCTTVAPSRPRQFRFNDIDLYLMGFISSSQAHPIYWYDLQPYNQQLQAQCTQHTISVDDIIKMEGSRQPAYPDAQRDFSVAFILLSAKGQNPTQAQIDKLNYIAQNFPAKWFSATRQTSRIVPAVDTNGPQKNPTPVNQPQIQTPPKVIIPNPISPSTSQPTPAVTSTLFLAPNLKSIPQAGTPVKTESEQISESLIEKEMIDTVKSIEQVKQEGNVSQVIYRISGHKKVNLLFIIPVNMIISIDVGVSAGTGKIMKINKPWWSFLAW